VEVLLAEAQSKLLCSGRQTFVRRPKGMLAHLARCEQVNVDQPESSSGQGVLLDEKQDFVVLEPLEGWKGIQERQDLLSIREVARGQFPNYERMDGDLTVVQQSSEAARGLA